MGFGWFWGLFSDTPISWDNYSWNASRFLNNVWMFMCFFWWIWLIWWIDGRRMLANLDSWWMVGFQRIWPIQCYFNPSQKQTWLATGQDPSPNISGTGTEPLALAKPRLFVCFFSNGFDPLNISWRNASTWNTHVLICGFVYGHDLKPWGVQGVMENSRVVKGKRMDEFWAINGAMTHFAGYMSKFAGYISTSIVSSILKKQQPSWLHTYIYIYTYSLLLRDLPPPFSLFNCPFAAVALYPLWFPFQLKIIDYMYICHNITITRWIPELKQTGDDSMILGGPVSLL